MYSISFWGSSMVFGTSRKEERSLMPGGVDGLSKVAFGVGVRGASDKGCGGGGGGGKGEFGLDDGKVEANEADFFCACIRSL